MSLLFAGLVLAQWARRRRSFQLVWAVGLLWYGISAGTEFWGSDFGWSEPLYRTWYLIGALFVAAYLGMGTVYLLARTRFGYFAAATIFAGGLFALLSQGRLAREGHPAPESAVVLVIAFATIAAAVIAYVTWAAPPAGRPRRDDDPRARVAARRDPRAERGHRSARVALDPATGVPVGTAIPGHIRVLSGPFNIAGAFTLVFGALFSAYVFMPKRKLLRGRPLPPVAAQLYGATCVLLNLPASLPLAATALARGQLTSGVPATLLIALGGFIPGITSGLNRFGITWSFFLGELIGVVLIFIGFVVSTEIFSARVRIGPFTIGRREVSTL